MRVNENLEKSLLELEESGKDNLLNILDVAQALEKTYYFINKTLISDEKGFQSYDDKYFYSKVGYDAINGKNIYSVKENETEVLKIEVSNLGEISFSAVDDKKEITDIINYLNEPSNDVLELIKMNSDISFFTQNKELVLSTKPYIALKMGNFVELDKAVLVYQEEQNGNEINKTNKGLKYIRVDQIEGYLQNIKVDERKVPILAYAFLGEDYSETIAYQNNLAVKKTYPKLTPEKVDKYLESKYFENLVEGTLCLGLGGGFCLSFVGAIIAATTPLTFLPCLLVGAGVPILSAVGIFSKGTKNITRSEQKEELITQARQEIYSALKECANENITKKEKEFISTRKAKQRKNITIKKDGPSSEYIRVVKKGIEDVYDDLTIPFLNIMLMHSIDNYSKTNDPEKELELFEGLSKISDEIANIEDSSYIDLINSTLSFITQRNVDYNITLNSLNELFNQVDILSQKRVAIQNRRNKFIDTITRAEAEIMLQTLKDEETLSIETIGRLSSPNRYTIREFFSDYGKKIGYFNDSVKKTASADINVIVAQNQPDEVRIVKMLDVITKNNLTTDLLGKELKPRAKVKELK